MKKWSAYLQWSLMLFLLFVALEAVSQRYTGRASFYADRFHKRRTASGELYHKDSLTCAHRTLPFGTYVKVTNLKNGKSVVVRVNDRGPFAKGRVVDLSKRAAKKLDFIAAGTAPVSVEPVSKPVEEPSLEPDPLDSLEEDVLALEEQHQQLPSKPALPPTAVNNNQEAVVDPNKVDKTRKKGYGVQLGSFEQADNALKMMNELQQAGFDQAYVFEDDFNGSRRYRLLVGPVNDRVAAEQLKTQLSNKGYPGFIVNP